MATFSALQTRVQSNVIDLPTAVLNQVPTFVNMGVYMIQTLHNFRVMQAEAPYITQAVSLGQTHVLGEVPTNWKAPRGNPYYTLFIGSVRGLSWQPEREYLYRKWNPTDVNQIGAPRDLFLGEPQNPGIGTGTTYAAWASGTTYASGAFVVYPGTNSQDPIYKSLTNGNVGNNPVSTLGVNWALAATQSDDNFPDYAYADMNIEVYPYPDGSSDWADGNYRVNVPYWGYVPALSSGSDSNWFTADGPRAEFVVAWASKMAFEMDWDETRSGYWQAMACGPKWDGWSVMGLGGYARQIIALDSGMQGTPSKTLNPRRDVLGPRDQWRQGTM